MKILKLVLTALLVLNTLAAVSRADDAFDAVVLEHSASFDMSSGTDGRLKVKTRVQVNNKNGLGAASFVLYTDSFRELTAFSASVESAGRVVKKLKKSDLYTVSTMRGLVEDSFLSVYEPTALYPFVVQYEYTVTYRNGIISFPPFYPVETEKTRLDAASFTLSVPSGVRLRYKSTAEPVISRQGRKDVYDWKFEDYDGWVDEHMSPSRHEDMPYVMSAPVDFEYGGMPGSQQDWDALGTWLYSLQQDTKDVPDELRNEILRLIEDKPTEYAKVRAIYEYLRTHTRYESIQLGIGGLKPLPVESVYRTGYGDCKALVQYMQALLKVAGIRSDYTVISSDRASLMDDFPSPGQMDHVILRVPLQNDTLWVECTNPATPLGYRHDSMAGHDVLLVTEDGGLRETVPAYPDTLALSRRDVDISLRADGSASCTMTRVNTLRYAEQYFTFDDRDPQVKFNVLMSGLALNPEAFKLVRHDNNFRAAEAPVEVPRSEIECSFDVAAYGRVASDRIFLECNPFVKSLYYERGERVNPVVSGSSGVVEDNICIHIPEGYELESLPESGVIDSPFGSLSVEVVSDGSVLKVRHILILKKGHFPKESYEEYRTFAKNVSKAYAARVVLGKKELSL